MTLDVTDNGLGETIFVQILKDFSFWHELLDIGDDDIASFRESLIEFFNPSTTVQRWSCDIILF